MFLNWELNKTRGSQLPHEDMQKLVGEAESLRQSQSFCEMKQVWTMIIGDKPRQEANALGRKAHSPTPCT